MHKDGVKTLIMIWKYILQQTKTPDKIQTNLKKQFISEQKLQNYHCKFLEFLTEYLKN